MPSIVQVTGDHEESMRADGYNVTITHSDDLQKQHEAAELERLLPSEMQPSSSSVTARHWGDPKLRKALKELAVSDRLARVATGLTKSGSICVLYSIPEVDAVTLETAFATRPPVLPNLKFRSEELASRLVHLSDLVQLSPGVTSIGAWWTRDGLVVGCAADDETPLTDLIPELP